VGSETAINAILLGVKDAASSPLAYAAYFLVIGAWTLLTYLRYRPQKKAEEILKSYSDKDRLPALRALLGSDPPKGLRADEILEWARLKARETTRLLLLIGYAITLVTVLSIFAMGYYNAALRPNKEAVRIAHPINFADQRFDQDKLRFDFILSNPSDFPVQLIKVGVRTFDTTGFFQCASAARTLTSLADYVVYFHVREPEVIQPADPPIDFDPLATGRITLSLKPSATGSCGEFWSTKVAAILVFSDGLILESDRHLITPEDVGRLNSGTASADELLSLLRHRDPRVRYEALQGLSRGMLDAISQESVLAARLDDPDGRVRSMAAERVASLKVIKLADQLFGHLRQLNDAVAQDQNGDATKGATIEVNKEVSAFIEALGKLRVSKAIDEIIRAFENLAFKNISSDVARALTDMQHPDVPIKIRSLIERHKDWESPYEDFAFRYLGMCEILSSYRDLKDIDVLSDAIRYSKSELIATYVIRSIGRSTPEDQFVADPFTLRFEPALLDALHNPQWGARLNAVTLLVRFPNQEIDKILLVGLNDHDARVRRSTAQLVAKYRAISLESKVEELLVAATGSKDWQVIMEREALNGALTALRSGGKDANR
jgi:HEAT repeat protein